MVAREVFAFCTSCTVALLGKHLDIITTVAAFGHHPPDPDLVTLAHKQGVCVVVGCDFDKTQLANATARTAWIGDQVANVKSLGIDGLNLDIEGNTANRDGLTALVTELRAALTAASPEYQLSFDLGIGPKGQASGYDHLALSRQMNFTVPMAYDECWGTKQATANSPIDRLKLGMDDYSSLGVPASKLVLGLPWYGWDFPCTEASGDVCSVDPPAGKPWYGYATQVGYTDVLKLANNSSLRPTTAVLDTESMTQHFDYVATSGQRHQVWYDDPTTLATKYEAVATKGGLGVAMWTANFGDEPMWEALRHFAK
jgi:di-N-acetylchitobiase